MTSENPGLPVTTVTLRCRHQKTSSNLTADFHEGVLLFGSNSTGEVAIHIVSKSDEGLYTCNMSDDGESPESWLADTGNTEHQPSIFSAFLRDSLLHPANAAPLLHQIYSLVLTEEPRETWPYLYVVLLLRTVFTIVLVPLLLLLVGLLHCGKLRVTHK